MAVFRAVRSSECGGSKSRTAVRRLRRVRADQSVSGSSKGLTRAVLFTARSHLHRSRRAVAVDMADPAIAATALPRATVVESQNGNDRREQGGKRQRTDDGAAPATSSTSAVSAPPIPSTTEASVNTIADFIESLADYEPTVREQAYRGRMTRSMQKRGTDALAVTVRCRVCQIPDEVVSSILRTTGCEIDDPRLSGPASQHNHTTASSTTTVDAPLLSRSLPPLHRADQRLLIAPLLWSLCWCARLRLISLSAQRFIFNVAEDAQQVSRLRSRQAGDESEPSSELTMDDLTVALSYQGIQVSKPAYYADRLDTPER